MAAWNLAQARVVLTTVRLMVGVAMQRVNPVCSDNCKLFIQDVRDSFGCCARFALETSALIIMDRDGTNE